LAQGKADAIGGGKIYRLSGKRPEVARVREEMASGGRGKKKIKAHEGPRGGVAAGICKEALLEKVRGRRRPPAKRGDASIGGLGFVFH